MTLSFVGTIVLGALTFWQNEKLREANDKLLNLERKSKRGYFVPRHRVEVKGHPVPVIAHHFLTNKRGIVLIGCGEDIILVKKTICFIDKNREIENDNEIFITTENEFKELLVPIKKNKVKELADNIEVKKEKLNIDIEMYLENSKGYKYKQILNLKFMKNDEDKREYTVVKFNSKFEDVEVV